MKRLNKLQKVGLYILFISFFILIILLCTPDFKSKDELIGILAGFITLTYVFSTYFIFEKYNIYDEIQTEVINKVNKS